MPGQIRQCRISGLLEDEAMHDEFEEAWTEREEARKAVHGTLTSGSAFRALRANGMQKTQGGHSSCRGQVLGGVRL